MGHTGVNWLETWMDMIGTPQNAYRMDIPLTGWMKVTYHCPREIMAVSRAKDTALQWLLEPAGGYPAYDLARSQSQ